MDSTYSRNRLNLSWLIKLRWSSIAGQICTIMGVEWLLETRLPLSALLALVALEAISNLLCMLWVGRHEDIAEWQVAAVMALDVALLTGLLYFTGGPENPFSFLYLVQIALAAIILRAYLTWTLVAVSLGSFGLLLLDHRPLDIGGNHQRGMWVALGVASAFIVYFLLRVTGALAQRERELAEARAQAARQQQLASLATMAGGAAHQLATPLSTIALVAKELERQLGADTPPETLEDVRLIREEVGRCRLILDQMSMDVGVGTGDAIQEMTLASLLDDAMASIRDRPEVRVEAEPDVAATVLRLPQRPVSQALRNVITNAQDASQAGEPIVVRASLEQHRVRVEVVDRGHGMAPDVLARIGEPFFTTKDPGRGMGLGLFLTRAVVEEVGGQLSIRSDDTGTNVALVLPTELSLAAQPAPNARESIEPIANSI